MEGGEAVGAAVVEHVDHSVGGHVDEHGSIGVATSPGEVVHAQHGQRCNGPVGQGADQPQQRHLAHLRPEPAGQPGTGSATQRQCHRGVEVNHVTVFRWVQRFAPLWADAARFTRHAPGDRWFVDETYVKVNGS
jgi:hypothetical protein